MNWGRCLIGFGFALLLIVGCGKKMEVTKENLAKMSGGVLKEVVPVSGVVKLDGIPQSGINIYVHASTGGQSIRQCRTDSEGKYCWTTYTNCDGLEPGDYKLVFRHIPKVKDDREGTDLLKGKFGDPMKSKYSMKVEKGKPQKDVDFDLVTK